MGLGPPVIALYRQLKVLGALDGVTDVMELGSQDLWCPQPGLMRATFEAFGAGEPPADLLGVANTRQVPARRFYESLGFSYSCADVDGRVGSLVLDLNFDSAPEEHRNRYGLVTNHGTSEHLLNQYNVFKIMHDFARPGGVMIHAVPFTVHLEHGFFNYQPNFFECLARYNSYETIGLWVGPDWTLASFIPWDPALLDFLTLNARTTHLLVVAQRKMYEAPFCVPFQEQYEPMVPDEARSRYAMVVDGELFDGKRVKNLTRDRILADAYLSEIQGLKNWIDSYKGQIDGLKHELAVAKAEQASEIQRMNNAIASSDSQLATARYELTAVRAEARDLASALERARPGSRPGSVPMRNGASGSLAAGAGIPGFRLEDITAKALAAELRYRVRRRLARMLLGRASTRA